MNKFKASYPHGQLSASGQAVGLPRGEDGNTETGHINLGAGRIVYQDLERINMSIADGTFFKNQVLLGAIEHCFKYKSNLHIMGLVGAGGVHSNIEHLFSLIRLVSESKFKNLFIHIFTDGRDSPPTASKTYIRSIQKLLDKENFGKIASLMGRYWAMDRDQRWDRTEKAYFALTKGIGNLVKTPEEAIDSSYSEGKTDEFIEPSLVSDINGKPLAIIRNNDSVIFFNFRIDRPRQLTKTFLYKDFSNAPINFDFNQYQKNGTDLLKNKSTEKNSAKEPFARGKTLENLYFVTMTDYGKPIIEAGAKAAFPPETIDMPLSEVISSNSFKQIKITESEKERFVTFYFNGLREKPYPLEERVIIPSPSVPTYDQKPEMSCVEITEKAISLLSTMSYRLAVINYPNPDMVGHTGNIGPTVKAIDAVDDAVGKLTNFVVAYDGAILITSDHGNAEEMINLQSGQIDTEHSINPVPIIIISKEYLGRPQKLRSGILADVAPTILDLLNINMPSNMTGRSLIEELVI